MVRKALGERTLNIYHSLAMSWKALTGLGAAFTLLVYGTVLVFLAFDRESHSVSDTVRPFILTMAPVWIVAIVAARVVLKRG